MSIFLWKICLLNVNKTAGTFISFLQELLKSISKTTGKTPPPLTNDLKYKACEVASADEVQFLIVQHYLMCLFVQIYTEVMHFQLHVQRLNMYPSVNAFGVRHANIRKVHTHILAYILEKNVHTLALDKHERERCQVCVDSSSSGRKQREKVRW